MDNAKVWISELSYWTTLIRINMQYRIVPLEEIVCAWKIKRIERRVSKKFPSPKRGSDADVVNFAID